jgi:hypothetical protein
LARFEENEVVPISVFRDDTLCEFKLSIQKAPLTTCYLELDDGADESASTRRELWLGT